MQSLASFPHWLYLHRASNNEVSQIEGFLFFRITKNCQWTRSDWGLLCHKQRPNWLSRRPFQSRWRGDQYIINISSIIIKAYCCVADAPLVPMMRPTINFYHHPPLLLHPPCGRYAKFAIEWGYDRLLGWHRCSNKRLRLKNVVECNGIHH